MTPEEEAEGVAAFWDNAHQKGSTTRLGNTEAHQYTEYFSKVGPFAQDLASATAVLDVGPGFAAYLRSIEGKDRHAIDVSDVSRKRVEKMGVTAHEPGKVPAGIADLATCLSVIQHCMRPAAEMIFSDVFRALRQGGAFYLNGIFRGPVTSHTQRCLRAGRCSYPAEVAKEIAEAAGFTLSSEHVYRLGSTGVWILRCVKP
jgi:predicted methyltransferase